MFNFREIDAKILKSLLEDGRKSFTDMAEELNTTKDQIWKHYKRMEKKGIITGSTVQINFESLGYEALASLLISVESQQIDQVMEYIGKIVEVRAYRQYNNVYNIRAVAVLKDLNGLDHVKTAIRRHLPPAALRTYLWTAVRNIPENLQLSLDKKNSGMLNKEQKSSLLTAKSVADKVKIDEIDSMIISHLELNGRVPFNQIAKEIGSSTDTVVKHYQKLKKANVIKVSIQIDPKKIGYTSILDFNIAFASPSYSSATIVESLVEIPDVIIIAKTSGDYDLQLTAMIRDVEQMFTIQEEIARISGITKIENSARKIPDRWPTQRQYLSTF